MSGTLLEWRPTRRPEVRLGPPLLRGAEPVHVVKDPRTDRRYELGPKEYFVLSRLDGAHSLAEIGQAYAERFHRRLGDGNWAQLLDLLAARDLLQAPGGGPPPPPPTAVEAEIPKRTLLRGELPVGRPAGLIRRVLRHQRWLFAPALLVPLLAVLLAMEAALATRLPELFGQARAQFRHPELALLAIGLMWLSSLLHELAHGLVGTRYGATTGVIGVRWRLPLVYFYCEVKDLALVPARRHRVATALAGGVADLAFLVPFFVLWWWVLPPGDVTRANLGALLLLGSLRVVKNLVPLAPLDGYHALCHGLNMVRLSTESHRYLRAIVRTKSRPQGYPQRAAAVYLTYGVFQILAVLGLVAAVAGWVLWRFPHPYGAVALGVLVLLIAARAVGLRMRDRRRQRKQATGRGD